MNSSGAFEYVTKDVMKADEIAASLDRISHQYICMSIREGVTDDPDMLTNIDILRLMRNVALESGNGHFKAQDAFAVVPTPILKGD